MAWLVGVVARWLPASANVRDAVLGRLRAATSVFNQLSGKRANLLETSSCSRSSSHAREHQNLLVEVSGEAELGIGMVARVGVAVIVEG